jgi:hypothetical protein
MLESRSYYHPHGETGSKPYKWCVKFIIAGTDHGIIGKESKAKAQIWLDCMMEAVIEGRIFQGFNLGETAVYYAR